MKKIRVRVYERQWGDTILDYVRYFDSVKSAQEFSKETNQRIEVLEEVEI